MSGSRELVIALDGSEPAFEELDVARDLAKAMGRELLALYIFPHQRGF